MKNHGFILTCLLALSFLSACGGGGGSDAGSSLDESTPEGYFEARIATNIIQNKCISCHVSEGSAEASLLVYTPSSNTAHAAANYNVVSNYIQNEPTRAAEMLEKVQGIDHPGGLQFRSSSTEYQNLKTFLEMIGGVTESSATQDPETATTSTTDADLIVVDDPQTYFNEHISPEVIQGKCIVCHVAGGQAQLSSLVYASSAAADHLQTNYTLLTDYISSDPTRAEYMLQKAQGASAHGGGAVLNANSTEYQKLRAFLLSIGGENVTQTPTMRGDFWDGVELASAEQTLRRAALIIARRLPSEEELAAVRSGDESSLRSTLRGLMSGEGFHQFLIDGANDRLHLKAFDNGLFLEVADLNGRPLFPLGAKKFFDEGDKSENWPEWVRHWQWGMTYSPLELIAHIVENDRSYQEVVTADYMMVNPLMDEILRSGTGLTESDSHRTFRVGQNNGQIVQDDRLQSEHIQDFGHDITSWGDYVDYPHAGILSSHAYLNRYPTTETNRNRARSRWTYYHFLGVDIEKSATRTTDPVALADTNNPTMNNSACTVCHELLDPVAGAFQNFGNEGYFRDSWGGLDSLPDTYKYPENFGADSGSSLYVHGDTWFRDMRTPGFNGMYVANASKSLPWLGQRIADDPRFATAAIKFWWPAIMGTEAKTPPEANDAPNFAAELAAFNEQNQFIEDLGEEFRFGIHGGSAFNAKDLFVELLLSPWFRANAATTEAGPVATSTDIGTGRLLTPEELEAKSAALLGWKWGEDDNPDLWDYDEEWTQLGNHFQIYYGGIDSNGIKERSRALTALMTNVAERQAVEMACPAVVLDFDRTDGTRQLFNNIDRTTTPASEFGEIYTVESANPNSTQTFRISSQLSTGSKSLRISYLNDWADESVGDRNLHIKSVRVANSRGRTVLFHDADNQVEGATNIDCGHLRDGLSLFCASEGITVPFEISAAGEYTIEVIAWGEQAGPDLIQMSVAATTNHYELGTAAGALAIKQKLIELHQQFLGETLQLGDEELEYSYRLLVETWQDRQDHDNNRWAWDWPNENCHFYLRSQWDGENSVSRRAQDPAQMLYTWTSMLIYLMTDFYYLHE